MLEMILFIPFHYAHCVKEEAEAQRREVIQPEPEINPGQSHFRGLKISGVGSLPLRRGDFSKPSSLFKGNKKAHDF